MAKKKNSKKQGRPILSIIQESFPRVTGVEDADEPLYVTVTEKDIALSIRKEHKVCPFATVCKRQTHFPAVIGLSMSYLINGTTAMRYKNSQAMKSEIISYDRNGELAAGIYKMSPVSASHRYGAKHYSGPSGTKKKGNGARRFRHFTTGVRTVLGQYQPPGIIK